MSKAKTAFFCQKCGTQSPKWIGKCPSCGEWNSYVEELLQKEKNNPAKREDKNKPVPITNVCYDQHDRVDCMDTELNRVLGGGIVQGSLILLGGEPGIGKSTLLLQLALDLRAITTLYISGEESESQIRMRAERLGSLHEQCFLFTETSMENIFYQIDAIGPGLVVIDSIQTLSTSDIQAGSGSVSQIRECTNKIMEYAKASEIPFILVGHITKEGSIAGPKILEHMVDTVLQFEGDRHHNYRIIRTLKNRFGPASELGIYEMTTAGMKAVENPSEVLISSRSEKVSGVAIGVTLEGNRALMIEVQSLVSPATFGTPQRSCTGYDSKRMNMLLAVLEKRVGYRLGQQDVFLNIAGGIRVDDPALDLAVCCSIVSSYEEIPIHQSVCFAAEIGLGGELRTINRLEMRVKEADKLGFKRIAIAKHKSDLNSNITPKSFSKIDEVIQHLF